MVYHSLFKRFKFYVLDEEKEETKEEEEYELDVKLKVGYVFEDLLEEVGDFHRYQKMVLTLFLIPGCIGLPIFSMTLLFLLAQPDHWCNVRNLLPEDHVYDDWKKILIPREVGPDGLERYSQCKFFNISRLTDSGLTLNEILKMNSTALDKTIEDCPRKYGWEYDDSNYGITMTSYYNWVCDQSSMIPFTYVISTIGNVAGLLVLSAVADHIGRVKVFFITIIVYIIFGVSMGFAPDQGTLLAFLIIKSSAFPVSYQGIFVQNIEIIQKTKRSFVNSMGCILWTIGMSLLPLVAWLCSQHWKILNFTTSILAIYLLFYWRFLKESPRWLISRGKMEQAEKVLLYISSYNRKPKPYALKGKIQIVSRIEAGQKTPAYKFFTHRKQVFRLMCLTAIWITTEMLYFGIHLTLDQMAGNPYLNYLALAAVELPSYLSTWYFMDRIGRRWTGFSFLFLGSVACILVLALPKGYHFLIILLAVIGKAGGAGTYMILYSMGAEVFPTQVRNLSLGIPCATAFICSLAAPFISHLGRSNKGLPYAIFGSIAMIASPLFLLLPETCNHNLPQTIEDANNFGLDQRFFSLNIPRQKEIRT